jgi:peptidoglycan/LPS O-acetylase OafA/YrhL
MAARLTEVWGMARPRPESSLSTVDGLRAVAVLGVVLWHCAPAPTTAYALGERGVDLFFVISGFCLSHAILRRRAAGEDARLHWPTFMRARARRILPPYFAMLLILGALSLTAFGIPGVQGGWPHDGLLQYLGYFFFLYKDPMSPQLNAALWTLALEVRWYLYLPFVLALYLRSKWAFGALMVLLYCSYQWGLVMPDIGVLPCFMLGIVAADLTIRDKVHSPWYGVAAIALIGAAVAQQLLTGDLDHGDILWHFAVFFAVLAGIRWGSVILASPILTTIGAASYGIYLIHTPFANLMRAYHFTSVAAFAVSVAIGLAFWRWIERPATAWASKRLGVAQPHSMVAASDPSVDSSVALRLKPDPIPAP